MSETGLCPDYLRVRFAGEGDDGFHPVDRDYELYDDEFQSSPLWRGHPEQRVDIAALRIRNVPETAVEAFLPNSWPTVRQLHPEQRRAQQGTDADIDILLRITDRLFVLGFPFGNQGSWPFAVWTAAPVASEPLARWDGLPGFLLGAPNTPYSKVPVR